MKIDPQQILNLSSSNLLTKSADDSVKSSDAIESFGDILNKSLNKVNDLQNQAQDTSNLFAAGEVEDIHTVMIATEKADMALQLTIQMRNKILDAYHEIMRMQV